MKPKVLYVDDETINLLNMKVSLRDEFEVYTARSAEDALTTIASTDVDVVLTDQKMPGMTGVELARAVREKGKAVPVIIVTGYLNDPEVDAAAQDGSIAGILHKPYSHNQFVETVRRHL